MSIWNFSADRMIEDYFGKLYPKSSKEYTIQEVSKIKQNMGQDK
jgi:hypothetical protein